MEKGSEHKANPPKDGGNTGDQRDDEEGPKREKPVVEEEDGELGGSDGTAKEDLRRLVGLERRCH